jgi:exopolysaccharide production protein ExoQ
MAHPAALQNSDTGTGIAFLAGTFFSFRMFIMLLSVRVLGIEPQSGTALSLVLNTLLLLLVVFQSVGTSASSTGDLARIPPIRWVLFFLAFSCLSLSWTVADSRFAAFGYWCAMAADVAIVIQLARADASIANMQSLMRGYVLGACLVACVAWLLPGQSDMRLGDEELLGANDIGYLCALGFFFAQYLVRQRIARYGAAAALLAVTMLRSLSKTTIVAFVLAQAYLLLRDKSITRRKKLYVVAAAAIVCLLFSNLLISYMSVYSNTGNSPETLTGRLSIWAYIFNEAISMPWIGHGFYSVWKVIPPFAGGEFEARHAHNEMLQQFYLFGFCGLVLLAGLYGSFFRFSCKSRNAPLKTFFATLVLFTVIRGLAEAEAYDFSLPLWVIVVFSTLLSRSAAEPQLHLSQE